jgi:signal transduction histidine kinase/ActR/RegA family two-component response regulator
MNIVDMSAVRTTDMIAAEIRRLMELGSIRFESVHRRKDGGLFDVEMSGQYQPIAGGQAVVFVRDITERKKLEEQVRQAEKMEAVGTLAGGIAHEFNNMISVITLNAELARDDVDGRPRTNIEEIISASQRAADLVRQILTFSRKSERQKYAVSLIPLVKETYKLLRSTLPATIEMQLEMKAASDTIIGDPSQIQQVLMNLATNAYHAMRGKGGRLLISLSDLTLAPGDKTPDSDMRPGRYVRLSVKDTGTGIADDVITRIFEPFFTTKEKGQGTGLGLAVVYGIVKSHGGTITVETKVGEGSTFTILFPATEDVAEEKPEKRGVLPTGTEKVLVVDDEPSIVKATSEMLRRLGYRVTTATGGPEGWSIFQLAPQALDLVITDAVMPEMTGMELAQKLLEVRPEIPIILFTAYGESVSPEELKATGIREFLIKPCSKQELAETVRRLLDSQTG